MKKASFVIKTREGFKSVEGYITADGKHGIDNRNGKFWYITDIPTGIGLNGVGFPKRKDAEASITELEKAIKSKKVRDTENYKNAVKELKEYMGKANAEVKAESEDKTMSTDTKAKANTATKRNNYKAENEALKKEIEILKKQIEELTRVEKVTIDSFDVEGYLASRDNSHRITNELVEAIGNTKGLKAVFKNASKEVVPFSGTEWLYVSGETEADTKERKDIFKAMSFKWSAPEKAWVLAPYPIRSKKAWGAKKARKASATA